MRYHIRERFWTLTEAFIIRDEAGQPAYEVQGKFFHMGDDLTMFDIHTGQEVVRIKQRLLSFMPRYEIFRDNSYSASMHEQFRLFGESFKVEVSNGSILHVDGDFWQWNFTVSDNQGNLLAHIGRQFSLFRDSYAVDVAPGADAPFFIAMAIVIDMIREHHEQGQHH